MLSMIILVAVLFAGCNEQNIIVDNSQPGWLIQNDQIELFITRQGGHMAPVRFYRGTHQPIQPYYISPWQNENLEISEPVLVPTRGDFFCLPFGGNTESYQDEKHNAHGETAGSEWDLVNITRSEKITKLTLNMKTLIRKGQVTKNISLVHGENNLYISHTLSGFNGKMPIGHHATLAVPEKEKILKVSVGHFDLGMTNPSLFGNPANGEYQSLAIGAEFTRLEKVPLLWKQPSLGDCSSFPQRQGFTDLLCVFKKPSPKPAWTTAVNEEEGYLWFALKDAAMLPCTIFWISNKGRHGHPWNGRNRCLGLEETCSYFADGLAASAKPNIITKKGFATSVNFSSAEPTVINMIQGVVKVPDNFGKVKDVRFGENIIHFISETGAEVSTEVNYDFLKTGDI